VDARKAEEGPPPPQRTSRNRNLEIVTVIQGNCEEISLAGLNLSGDVLIWRESFLRNNFLRWQEKEAKYQQTDFHSTFNEAARLSVPFVR